MYLTKFSRVKDQGRTKEEPRNDLRTPKHKKCFLLRLPSLLLLLYPALFHRPTTERTPTQLPVTQKCFFLRLLLNQVVLIPKKVDSFPEIVDLSISQQNHPITLKTFKTPKTFSTQNLHIRKFYCTFAPQSEQSVCRHIIKAFISACFGERKSCKISQTQNKKAVNALWDMTIPPQSVHAWTALFGGISYSAWALCAYILFVGSCRNLRSENKQR